MSFKGTNSKSDSVSRRAFMAKSACAAMGVTGIVNSLSHLRLMNAAMAAGTGPLADYKALVVVFLEGGNDSNNMLIPGRNHPSRSDYDSNRGVLAIAHENDGSVPASERILPINDPVASLPYGLHPAFGSDSGTNNNPGPAALYNSGDLAFVANVGTLTEPIVSRAAFLSGNYSKPPQLYSHSDQQVQMQSSVPDQVFQTGWGGRAADILNASYNGRGSVSMNISLNNVNKLQVGTAGGVSQYVVTSNGARSLNGYGGNYASAATLNPDGTVRRFLNTKEGHRLKGFEKIMRHTHHNLLEQGYNEVVERARGNEAFVSNALLAAGGAAVDFDAIFDGEDHDLGNELEMVAKLIAGRECFGNQRQIYFVSTGGWDNHQSMLTNHAVRLSRFGGALAAFNEAIKQLGLHDDVLTISQSDFTRTLIPNRTDPAIAGSDHGYGGHQVVMGGPVAGGKVYGTFPPLKVGNKAGSIDTSSTRGRWIPSTSTDQYLAVAADWFGIERDSSEMETIFPNLNRFDDPFDIGSTNLLYTG